MAKGQFKSSFWDNHLTQQTLLTCLAVAMRSVSYRARVAGLKSTKILLIDQSIENLSEALVGSGGCSNRNLRVFY
jgi:hypothetical protein